MSETSSTIEALAGAITHMVDDLDQVKQERDSAETRIALVVERLNRYLGGVHDEQETTAKTAEVAATKDFARQVLFIATTEVQ